MPFPELEAQAAQALLVAAVAAGHLPGSMSGSAAVELLLRMLLLKGPTTVSSGRIPDPSDDSSASMAVLCLFAADET